MYRIFSNRSTGCLSRLGGASINHILHEILNCRSQYEFNITNIPSTVYVCRQTLPVLCLHSSIGNAAAVYQMYMWVMHWSEINTECILCWCLKKQTNNQTIKQTNKERTKDTRWNIKRPCLQHWPNFHDVQYMWSCMQVINIADPLLGSTT